jgi:uncharacterized membrane protein YeaQ/YmgE (transglycosylase-associated protein family)
MLLHVICSLIMGAIIGWIASMVMHSNGGLLRNIVVGIFGSVVGSVVLGLLGFYAYGWLADFVVSIVGACIFIWLGRLLFR